MNITIESQRLHLQAELDAAKTQAERNRLGQFATPSSLAHAILVETKRFLESDTSIHFLDPAFGTGAFYSALLAIYDNELIEKAEAYEIDPHYGNSAQELWQTHNLNLHLADFTRAKPAKQKVNLLVCNPPYVRHHHIPTENKKYLRQKTDYKLSGLSGLYAYFLLLAHDWLTNNGIGCWLIPSEWMDVNYGQQIKQYLTTQVKLLRIHRFATDMPQFEDALVSSTVVWYQKTAPNKNEPVNFTSGQLLSQPSLEKKIPFHRLEPKTKWAHLFQANEPPALKDSPLYLSDLFKIKRGIATGANKFFILTPEQISTYKLPPQFLKPILPSPRYLQRNEITAEDDGTPIISKRFFLLDCNLPEQTIKIHYPTLWQYLQFGREQEIDKRYLCRHRRRWYEQEERPPAPILCTYMGRNQQPFRFIRNHSMATAPNVYLMLYPTPLLNHHLMQDETLLQQIWNWLTQVNGKTFKKIGRSYGGGLFKLEPRELAQLGVDKQIINQMDFMPRPVQTAFSF
ncbi:MAG: SAM-dependent DNA methyltransferase [Chloroflexi bacterium]|nr:MAG: SAM-dependent DNA methyltransferase [Chloroflexota bacterium]